MDAPREGCYNSSPGVWLSLVERLLWEQKVAGSNPVTPILEYDIGPAQNAATYRESARLERPDPYGPAAGRSGRPPEVISESHNVFIERIQA